MAFAGRADADVDVVDELELKEATNRSTRLFCARPCVAAPLDELAFELTVTC